MGQWVSSVDRALWDSGTAQWLEHYGIVDSSVEEYYGIVG